MGDVASDLMFARAGRAAAILLAILAAAPAWAAPPTPTSCDTLSGMPPDIEIVTPDAQGMRTPDIDAVIDACRAATATAPREPRFAYRLGLALKTAKRYEEAASVLADGVALGSMGALDELAGLKLYSPAPFADPQAGIALYEQGVARWKNPELMRGLASGLWWGPEEVRDRDRARKVLDQAVAMGHLPAMVTLGMIEKEAGDSAAAEALYQRAYDAGSGWAAYQLGDRYWTDDPAAARRFYEAGTERGSSWAAYRLGQMAQLDLAGPWTVRSPEVWFGLAADRGYAPAMYELGELYKGRSYDPEIANRWYRLAAARGNADAMNAIGYRYESGRGGRVDLVEARKWYKRAAAQGQMLARHNLAMMYLQGHGGPKAEAEGLALLQETADAGLDVGVSDLAWVYQMGVGVPQDETRARELYRKAADLGSFEAQQNLASMLEEGEGGPKDLAEARRLFKQAAESGFANAMYRYAMRVYYDEPAPASQAEARTWLAKAVAAGDIYGLPLLAQMTADGVGGPADPVEAHRLFELGGAAPDPARTQRTSMMGAPDNPALAREFARRLRSGDGLVADPEAAEKILAVLATMGDEGAATDLAEMKLGRAGRLARGSAVRELERLADAGQPRAMVLLAGAVRDAGDGPEQQKRARELLTKAAENGEETAFAPLAAMMISGTGGPVDLPGAARQLLRTHVRDGGQAVVMLDLAQKLSTAKSAEAPALIRRLWQRAALWGEPGAVKAVLLPLARMFADGTGGARDPDKAARSYLAAFDAGDAQARDVLMKTPKDLAQDIGHALLRQVEDRRRARPPGRQDEALEAALSAAFAGAEETGPAAPAEPALYPYCVTADDRAPGRAAFSSAHPGLSVYDTDCGFIDRTGAWVVQPRYWWVSGFSDGLAAVLGENGRWGFIDPSGREVLKPAFGVPGMNGVPWFQDGLAVVGREGRDLGIIDKTGRQVMPPDGVYKEVIAGGFILSATGSDRVSLRMQVHDRSGALVLADLEDAEVGDGQGPLLVKKAGRYGVFDLATRRWVLKPSLPFIETNGFFNGLAAVRAEAGWGYIDESGTIVIEPQFSTASEFRDGIADVSMAGQYDGFRFIDETGAFANGAVTTAGTSYGDGLAGVWSPGAPGSDDKGPFRYVDRDGVPRIELGLEYGGRFKDGLAAVDAGDDRPGVIDRSGRWVLGPLPDVNVLAIEILPGPVFQVRPARAGRPPFEYFGADGKPIVPAQPVR